MGSNYRLTFAAALTMKKAKTVTLSVRVSVSDRATLDSLPLSASAAMTVGLKLLQAGLLPQPTPGRKKVRVIAKVSPETLQNLRSLAERRQLPVSEVFRLSVAAANQMFQKEAGNVA